MDIIKNLKANLGGTDISSPLKEIFNSKDYDDINLARNLFILTDGEVNNREECLSLINTHSDKFKVHAIGIGSSFDKQLIQNAGIQGRGTYNFVANISDVNSIIIESLSKCLRNYVTNAKINLNELKPEYDFIPKMNFIYPDEIINYYFILKGKDHEKIQINFENSNKNENIIFTKDKIIKESDGEIIGQIIVGNKLKNEENMEEEKIIKLSKDYQILSKKTSLFAVAENEENNKVGELIQITKKKKKGLFDDLMSNNMVGSGIKSSALNSDIDFMRRPRYERNDYMDNMMIGSASRNVDYDMAYNSMNDYSRPIMAKQMASLNYQALDLDEDGDKDEEDDDDDKNYNKNVYYDMAPKKMKEKAKKKKKAKRSEPMEYESKKAECKLMKADSDDEYKDYFKEDEKEESKPKLELKKEIVNEEKKVEFSIKELVLTQDIFDGCWNLNPQTKLLIEKEKNIYEKIENIMKEKKIEKEEVKITLLVLYYLNTDTNINKVEYMLIIKKGISFLEENGIKFDEILTTLKN